MEARTRRGGLPACGSKGGPGAGSRECAASEPPPAPELSGRGKCNQQNVENVNATSKMSKMCWEARSLLTGTGTLKRGRRRRAGDALLRPAVNGGSECPFGPPNRCRVHRRSGWIRARAGPAVNARGRRRVRGSKSESAGTDPSLLLGHWFLFASVKRQRFCVGDRLKTVRVEQVPAGQVPGPMTTKDR